MLKKLILLAAAAAAALSLTLAASAATFTSSDGVLSIELPNDSWKEIADPTKWIALSDGDDLITIEHYSNGETLPAMTVASNNYVNVYQAIFSTQNEIFIITGSVVDAAQISAICNSIMSAKVLQYDTKLAVKKDQPPVAASTEASASRTGFNVVPASGTYYVNCDSLYVRSSWSSESGMIGSLANGSNVSITGKVQQNGSDYGWYQISYNGQTGYVNSAYLSSTAPASGNNASSSNSSIKYTGRIRTIYEIDGHPVTISEAYDGSWYDSEGHKYTQTSDYDFEADNGAPLTVNKPNLASAPSGSAFTVYWPNGNATTLTPYNDGYYYSAEWIRYSGNADGSYSGADGSTLFDEMPNAGVESTPELVQCPYCGDWFEEGNIFRNHYCPEKDAALAAEEAGPDTSAGNVDYVKAVFLSGGVTLYSYDGYSYVDDTGDYWWEEENGWTNGDGNYFYEVG